MNAGEFGSIPLLALMSSWTPLPLNVGSGKFDNPCERMHCENWSAAVRLLAVSGAPWPPFGSNDWHAFIADRNAGPLTATPFTDVLPGVD